MRYGTLFLAGLIAVSPAAAAVSRTAGDSGPAITVAAKRLSLDQIAKASRPSAPRRVIYAKPYMQGRK